MKKIIFSLREMQEIINLFPHYSQESGEIMKNN